MNCDRLRNTNMLTLWSAAYAARLTRWSAMACGKSIESVFVQDT